MVTFGPFLQDQEDSGYLLHGREGVATGRGRDWTVSPNMWLVARHLFPCEFASHFVPSVTFHSNQRNVRNNFVQGREKTKKLYLIFLPSNIYVQNDYVL